MNKEEIEHKIIRDNCKHYHLINELLAIRCKKNEKEEYTICVDGYISIDSIKETIELENKVEQLENKVKELTKGNNSLIQSRKKWKDRYYKEKAKVKELENVLDERFIYVVRARTIYRRLMQLPKELIIKDDLKRRNEINILINEKNELENKVKEQDKRINGLLKERQVVIDKLNKTTDKANEIINDQEFRYIEEVIDEEWVRRKLAQELLNLIEGEKDV